MVSGLSLDFCFSERYFHNPQYKIEKQGKKVCKATAARCVFVFVCWHRGEAIQSNGYYHHQNIPNSYIGELLTAADRCKNKDMQSCQWPLVMISLTRP